MCVILEEIERARTHQTRGWGRGLAPTPHTRSPSVLIGPVGAAQKCNWDQECNQLNMSITGSLSLSAERHVKVSRHSRQTESDLEPPARRVSDDNGPTRHFG